MENMELYEKARSVPEEAKSPITDGRLKGKTDINPMWRIKRLTEIFGPCGVGWWYEIKSERLQAGAGEVVCAFVDIDLYYKTSDGKVSQPIPGTGGSTFVAQESRGPHTSDECFKMALTDAISVSAKALGIGADVYWDKDSTKYDTSGAATGKTQTPPKELPRPGDDGKKSLWVCADCGREIQDMKLKNGKIWPAPDIAKTSMDEYGRPLCGRCGQKEYKRRQRDAGDSAPKDEKFSNGVDPLAHYCQECGVEITPTTQDGRLLSVPEICRTSQARWGADLCIACQEKYGEAEAQGA